MKDRAWGRIVIIVAISCVLLLAGATALGAVGRTSRNLPERIARDRSAAAPAISVPIPNNPHADASAQAVGNVMPDQTNHPEGAGS